MDKQPRIEIHNENGKHFFKVISVNNKTIATSEPYNTKKLCSIAVHSIIAIMPKVEIVLKKRNHEE